MVETCSRSHSEKWKSPNSNPGGLVKVFIHATKIHFTIKKEKALSAVE